MKQIYFLLFLLISAIGFSQTEFTAIPDESFEEVLIDRGIDSDGEVNGQVLTSDIAGVTTLEMSLERIFDLTGIEGFTALEVLDVSDNGLRSLNVTQNTALTSLTVFGNGLTALDVTQNPALTTLRVFENELQSLDVSQNPALETLDVGENRFLTLNVSQNPALEVLNAFNNQLLTLDVSQNPALTTLVVWRNSLTNLDLTQNPALTTLNVFNNPLRSLNVQNGNNENLTNFFANITPDLSCIQVDDPAFAETNFTTVDAGVGFSTDCENFLSVDDFQLQGVVLSPNPTSSILNIDIPSNVVLERIDMYDSVGQSLRGTQQTTINVSDLSNGVYFLEIVTDKGRTTSRFIKR